MISTPPAHTRRSAGPGAFTLIETVVVVGLVTLLVGLLGTGLMRVRGAARSVKCLAHMRVAAVDFQLFAEDGFNEDRGRSYRCRHGEFFFQDYVERQYKVDEFWEGTQGVPQEVDPSSTHMICPSASQELKRYPDRPCNDGALQPFENVSYAFNRRLFAETIRFDGRLVFNPKTKVNTRILDHPNVPLLFDGDGEEADSRNRRPYFSAPPVPGHRDLYETGRWWFPSDRHLGKTNVIFVGCYARSSNDPATEKGWDWTYQPSPLR